MRIFIIGFMCSGKSRIGRELAAAMGVTFHDIDRVIEKQVGPITPWFIAHGEEAFREVEREVLLELIQEDDCVIACGGGTPFSFDNMERMLAGGTVVYLDVPLDVLVERAVRTGGDRPLLFGLKGAALAARVEELLAARRSTYEQAPVRIAAGDAPLMIVARIQQALEREGQEM